MKPRIGAIIQARLGSHRLSRKVLRRLGHQTMLEWVVERAGRSKLITDVMIATTTETMDDELSAFCDRKNWPVFRGDEHDVLTRYQGAAQAIGADFVVRITSDCPFIDAGLIDQVILAAISDSTVDYACNFYPERRFPRGLDVECFPVRTLERLDAIAIYPELREHVTLGVYRNPELFSIIGVVNDVDLSQHRWTVDTDEDFTFANRVADHFGRRDFGWREMLTIVESRPEWTALNACIQQKPISLSGA
ncbi:MAG: glycosyltransferase family protein [Pirellulaceae bacterium]